ncbi:hypothetical protein [Alkalicoccobacillus plakortidis]|uniref:Secreted protein n=1 Tax=Alkalicoccobacillus plakortidis TaxID=444060 RepID=A0ABT0XLJ8_9BACI|nr:hypothetical protein [Alkalicoccobacillus plakortidis]MCM2676787.1 hypothetical protein [Alkalicoccobacillus plakortidis]
MAIFAQWRWLARIFWISAHGTVVSAHFSHFRAPTIGFRAFFTFPRTNHRFPRILHFPAHRPPVSAHFPLSRAPTIGFRAFFTFPRTCPNPPHHKQKKRSKYCVSLLLYLFT